MGALTYAAAIKAITADGADIEGYGILFDRPGSPVRDRAGEYFTRDSDLELDRVPVKMTFVDHSLSGLDYPVGEVTGHAVDDTGVKFRGRLFTGDKLKAAVKRYAEVMGHGEAWITEQCALAENVVKGAIADIRSGKMGFSSGAVNHLVKRVNGWLKRWPVYELSITTAPCEPRLVGAVALKSLAALQPDLDLDPDQGEKGDLLIELEPDPERGGLWHRVKSLIRREPPKEEHTMELKDIKALLDEALKGVKSDIATVKTDVAAQVTAIKADLDALKVNPADKTEKKPTDDKDAPNPAIKSLTDAIVGKRYQIVTLMSGRTEETAALNDKAIKALQGDVANLESAIKAITGEGREDAEKQSEIDRLAAAIKSLQSRSDASYQAQTAAASAAKLFSPAALAEGRN